MKCFSKRLKRSDMTSFEWSQTLVSQTDLIQHNKQYHMRAYNTKLSTAQTTLQQSTWVVLEIMPYRKLDFTTFALQMRNSLLRISLSVNLY